MKIYLVNYCVVVSWVAVVTLTVFAWVAKEEPRLMEIEHEKAKKGRETLFLASIFYLVIALVITTFRGCLMRGESVSEGMTRLKGDMRRVLRAGERHNTTRTNARKESDGSSGDLKYVSLGQNMQEESGLDTSQRSSDNQNLLG
jgi:hypothetical protein